jgi:hypothetical protein
MNTLLLILGIFAKAKAWAVGTAIAGILALAFVKKWMLKIDWVAKFVAKYSNTIALVMKEGSDVFLGIHDTAQKIDDAISDDGSTDLNTLKEAITLGKNVKVELDDVILIVKPKK